MGDDSTLQAVKKSRACGASASWESVFSSIGAALTVVAVLGMVNLLFFSLVAPTPDSSQWAPKKPVAAVARAEGAPVGGEPVTVRSVSQDVSALTGFAATLIVTTIILEKCTHTIDSFLEHKPYLLAMLYKLYRELMVLGIVSFVFFFMEVSGTGTTLFQWLDAQSDNTEEELHFIFEIVHIALFLGMVIYVLLATFLIILSVRISNFWNKAEKLNPATVSQKYADKVKEKQDQGSCKFRVRNCVSFNCFSFPALSRQHRYQELRVRFIAQQDLHPRFKFNSYLKQSLRNTILDLVDIHWSVWFVALIFLLLNWARYRFISSVETSVGGLLFLGYGWALLGVLTLAFYKVKRIVRVITKKGKDGLGIIDRPHPSGTVAKLTLDPIRKTTGRPSSSKKGKHGSKNFNHPGHVSSSDSDEELGHLDGIGKTDFKRRDSSGKRPPPNPNKKAHKKLFWLRKPAFTLHLIQTTVLFMAFYMGAFAYYFVELSNELDLGLFIPFIVAFGIPPLTSLFIIAPNILPDYAIAVSIGGLVNERVVYEMLQKDRIRVRNRLAHSRDLDVEANRILMSAGEDAKAISSTFHPHGSSRKAPKAPPSGETSTMGSPGSPPPIGSGVGTPTGGSKRGSTNVDPISSDPPTPDSAQPILESSHESQPMSDPPVDDTES